MGLTDMLDVARTIGSYAAGLVAFYALSVNALAARRNKSIDIIVKCSERYVALEERNTDEAYDPEKDVYFRKYWALENDQFDYWLSGFIDPETMASWAFTCSRHLREDKYKDSWKYYYQQYAAPDPVFTYFINFIIRQSQDFSDIHLGEDLYLYILNLMDAIEEREQSFINMHRGRFSKILISHATARKFKEIYLKSKMKNPEIHCIFR